MEEEKLMGTSQPKFTLKIAVKMKMVLVLVVDS